MIYVDRSKVPVPELLISPRADAERKKIAQLLTGSKAHLAQTRIRFNSQLWLAAKPALLELFHGKCAYCESKVLVVSSGEVEHFRPKGGVEHADGTRSHYYYAWLAYDWENLLLVCQLCIAYQGKRALFPVKGDRARLLASVEECRNTEDYALLDPCFDRPEQHISFNKSGECIALSERGRVTIFVLGLNRPNLVEARSSTWQEIETQLKFLLTLESQERLVATEAILKKFNESSEYSAVVRAALGPDLKRRGIQFDAGPAAAEPRRPADHGLLAGSEDDQSVLPADALKRPLGIAEPRARYGDRKKLPPHAHQTIRRIEIRNFKGIQTIDLQLRERSPDEECPPMLMLLGENATGKSSILEAIALALLGVDETKRLGLNTNSFVHRPNQSEPLDLFAYPAEIIIHFEGGGEPVRLTIHPHSGQLEGHPEPATVLLGYGPRRFFSDRRRVRRLDNPSARVRTLFDPLAVISNPTSWLMNCNDTNFNAAIRALRELLLLPEEAHVTRPPRGERRGKEIMFEVQGEPEPLRRLSEGYKTTIATGVDIMREMLEYWPDLESAQGIVLIDELDTHLHPRWKMRIVGRLRQAMPRVQFIATTHDPLCLRGLADGEVQVLRRDENGQIERVIDLPNVRGLSVEQLLTSQFFGLYSTEDPKFEEDMGRYVALSTKQELSPEEKTELEHYRNLVHQTMTLGSTPQHQLVQEAASQYLLEQKLTPAQEQAELKQAAVKRIIDLWKSAPAGDVEL